MGKCEKWTNTLFLEGAYNVSICLPYLLQESEKLSIGKHITKKGCFDLN